MKAAEQIIQECQAAIEAFLTPDSFITEAQCFDRLVDILGNPEARRFAAPETVGQLRIERQYGYPSVSRPAPRRQ